MTARGIRLILSFARPYLGRLVGAGLLAAATELAGLMLMATATWLLITAAGRPPLPVLTVAIVSVRALAIGRGLLRYTERLAGHDAVLRMITDVRARVFATLAARRTPEVGERSGDALSRLVSDVEAVQDLLLRVIVPGMAAILVAVLALLGTAAISPAAALALTAGLMVAGVILPTLAISLARRTADAVAPLRGDLAAHAIDLTHGAADLAAFGATRTALQAAGERVAELARLERRLALSGWGVDGAGVLVSGVTAAAVVAAALRDDADGVLVGVLAVGTLAAVETTLALTSAARQWVHLQGALRRVAALLEPIATPTASPETVAHGGSGGLLLRDVQVRYRAAQTPALDGLTLAVPAGYRLAVVGPSGAGKSTLLAVLSGAVLPTAGRATLDGVPVSSYPAEAVPAQVGGLLADAHVFHATIRENLLVGRPQATTADLMAAATTAGLLGWIQDQPQGWDTLVGEDGAKLSGGQRQRLALARALLLAPRCLVLDEPTEGLDPAAARQVLASVLRAAPVGGSVILVTHRLAGLAEFDEVVVLDGGRIVQRGRHQELLAQPGWYAQRWLAQEVAERGYLTLRS